MPIRLIESLQVPLRLWKDIDAQILTAFPKETGGILLGKWNEAIAEVTSVVGAGPLAEHERTSFDPDQRWQVAEVARRYAERPDSSEYLGDWHSHPNGSTQPSMTDWWAASRIARYRAARNPKPLMMICAANKKGIAEVRVFQFWTLRLQEVRLRIGE